MKYDARACKFNIDTGCVELQLPATFFKYSSGAPFKIKSA